jgi:hypothetical protein
MAGGRVERRQMTALKNGKTFVKVAAAIALSSSLAGCMGWVPGRKAYWDDRIKELCEKEGHVEILEKVILTKTQAEQMPRTNGQIALLMKSRQTVDQPVYAEVVSTRNLRESNPRVWRDEMVAVRSSDKKVVARWVEYARTGGDLATGLFHDSSFGCPDPVQRLAELQLLFVIQGD